MAILILTVSCAALTRHYLIVERDEFLNKFPMVNYQILGELKYDDPNLDLQTLGIKNYPELFGRVDLTEDYKKVVHFLQNHAPERKFVVQRNTFIICLRSKKYVFVVYDGAATPSADKVQTGEPIPTLDDFCAAFLSKTGQGASKN